MALTDIDSNTFDTVISFKKSLQTEVVNDNPSLNPPADARQINEYGEVEANRMIQQQKRLNAKQIARLVEGYNSGKSVYELAEQFGCHRTTVSRQLKLQGVNVTISKFDSLDADNVTSMYAKQRTLKEISDKYCVGPQVVARCLRENGVKIRGRWG